MSLKITVYEHPYFGHGTVAQHVYNICESLDTIKYDTLEHKLVIDFTTCSDKLELRIDELTGLKIEAP